VKLLHLAGRWPQEKSFNRALSREQRAADVCRRSDSLGAASRRAPGLESEWRWLPGMGGLEHV
jgi:hypothetical protein